MEGHGERASVPWVAAYQKNVVPARRHGKKLREEDPNRLSMHRVHGGYARRGAPEMNGHENRT